MQLVLDSSVLIAAVQPAEPKHADALVFVDRLRAAITAGDVNAFAPPELWLEVHVVDAAGARAPRARSGALIRIEPGRCVPARTCHQNLSSPAGRGPAPSSAATYGPMGLHGAPRRAPGAGDYGAAASQSHPALAKGMPTVAPLAGKAGPRRIRPRDRAAGRAL
jgi:hypothetical protein